MGAWGWGSFENDEALDWVFELEQSKDLSVITGTLDANIDSDDDYLDATDCSMALAAAETVAALAGRPEPSLPEEVARWVKDRQKESSQEGPFVDESVTAKARRAIEAILSDSELKELWEETDELEQWKATVTDLLVRLG
jgi:hypothetical protein